ncbi:MAG: deoxynucleoside kinase [Anaerolineae bacterium]
MPDETRPQPWYIAIEGAIGVGKTTLARLLKEELHAALILEVFEENPFLSSFYQDRARYAFQTQMFFLLSRYRQQQRVPAVLSKEPLISDYMFAKDRLFAELNLHGDEWDIYQQIHGALAQQITTQDLVVYLRADTDVLMSRITLRDRPYERSMERRYIDALRQAYERFFLSYEDTPVLPIDTNDLNFVTSASDFQSIVTRVRSALREGSYQQKLPQFQETRSRNAVVGGPGSLSDYQRFHVELDKSKGFITDLYFNYLCLGEEMGELGSELAQLWREETELVFQGNEAHQARQLALDRRRAGLQTELADCMAYLLKMANYAGIDLESAYREKMKVNESRTWD